MPLDRTAGLAPFAVAALAASRVGTWERDAERGLFRCDPTMASIYGLAEEEAEAGVAIDRVRAIVHEDDQLLFGRKLDRAARHGGLIVVEYRIVPRPGTMRWVLVRGRYEPVQPGQALAAGRGIVIDITDTKLDDLARDNAFLLTAEADDRRGETPLHRAADHALALRRELKYLGADGQPAIVALDIVLYRIGRALAKSGAVPQ